MTEGSEDDSGDEEMTFVIKSLREKKDGQKGYFNYKKFVHFITECRELQNDKPKKGSFHKDSFNNKFKKNLISTWDELDNEEDSKKDEDQANLSLMTLTSFEAELDSDSGLQSEEDDEVFSKLSHSDLIIFVQDLM
ncbi:hypothetical protein KIW84_015929 [Lathyrus oleraceus]|uniref:Uncharacterized protein n=1 Tax=Pisum sativum TaxID=3888 RepID=A0A9D5BS59_PEA|nr:hypothetical protein KIW84_015929 [Pisum sativum]